MNEGGFGTRAGAARHTKRLFCFYFPEGIYIYISIKWLYILSYESKRSKDTKQKKMQLYVPSLHVLNLRSTYECTCNVCARVWGHQVVKATLCFVYVHVFFFLSCVMVNPWGLCVCAFRGPHFSYSKVFLTFWYAPLRTSTVHGVTEMQHESFNGQPTTHVWTWITFSFPTYENICCKRAQCPWELPRMLCSCSFSCWIWQFKLSKSAPRELLKYD